jgi:Sec-independent protein translocase protein TatA
MSGGELFLLLLIALVALGAHRLPEAGRTLGKGLRDVQRALNEARRSMDEGIDDSRAPARRDRLID